MKKNIKWIIIFFSIIIILLIIYLIIKTNAAKKSTNIPDNYIVVFHGGAGEIVYETYIYQMAKDKFQYINVTKMTTSYGKDEWNMKITGKGKITSKDDIFKVAEKNYAYSYVTLPNDDKTYTIEEYQNMVLMN